MDGGPDLMERFRRMRILFVNYEYPPLGGGGE